MRKDLKIGMVIGTVLITAAMVVISLWPSGSLENRLQKFEQEKASISQKNDSERNVPFSLYMPPESSEPDETVKKQRIHVVAKGETLGDIAEKYYGNSMMINRIVDANGDVITDTNVIKEGMRLVIP